MKLSRFNLAFGYNSIFFNKYFNIFHLRIGQKKHTAIEQFFLYSGKFGPNGKKTKSARMMFDTIFLIALGLVNLITIYF